MTDEEYKRRYEDSKRLSAWIGGKLAAHEAEHGLEDSGLGTIALIFAALERRGPGVSLEQAAQYLKLSIDCFATTEAHVASYAQAYLPPRGQRIS
jgi:hypothetical protein